VSTADAVTLITLVSRATSIETHRLICKDTADICQRCLLVCGQQIW